MGVGPYTHDPDDYDGIDQLEWGRIESPDGDTYVDDGKLWDTHEWIRDDLIDGYDAVYGDLGLNRNSQW